MYCFDNIIDRTEASGTYSMKWQGYQKQFAGYNIHTATALPMWVADMDFPCPKEVVDVVTKRAQHGIYGYTSPECTQEFFSAAAAWIPKRQQWRCSPTEMLYFPGVVPAIYTAIQAYTKPGDGVIIQNPVYYPFMRAIEQNGRETLSNPLCKENDHYEIDLADLERVASNSRAKLLVLCNPHNPVGRVWTKEVLIRVLEICRAYNITLFSDEIHCDLTYPGNTFVSLGSICNPEDRVIIAQSPSKTFNLAGMQTSVLISHNEEMRETIAACALSNKLPNSNAFGTLAGTVAYHAGENYLEELLPYLKGNMEYAASAFAQGGKAWMRIPEATYLAWINFPGVQRDYKEIYHLILEKAGVVGDLGTWFGIGGEGYLRLNFACPRSVVEDAVFRINSTLGAL